MQVCFLHLSQFTELIQSVPAHPVLNPNCDCGTETVELKYKTVGIGLDHMATNYINMNISISVDIDNYHNKCDKQFLLSKFKD